MTQRVLIVDDDPRMNQTLAAICTHFGYTTDTVLSGTEALERLSQTHFICMLTDIHMPQMNGLELFEKVRQSYPELPVILMTGSVDSTLIGQGRAAGATEVMEKPLDLPYLLKMLAALRSENSVAIVDDDPGFARTLQSMLERQGKETAVYGDMASFLGNETAAPGLLILDVKLRESLGLDFLERLRQSHPNTQIILITGFRREYEHEIRMALSEHFNAIACLYKPFSIGELTRALKAAQQSRQRQHED